MEIGAQNALFTLSTTLRQETGGLDRPTAMCFQIFTLTLILLFLPACRRAEYTLGYTDPTAFIRAHRPERTR